MVCGIFCCTVLFMGSKAAKGFSVHQNMTVPVQAQATAAEALPVVILDAGHGGEDGGAISADGVAEKTLNLSITLRLGDMLSASGVSVIYTRTEDDGLYAGAEKGHRKMTDLRNRLAVWQANPNAMLVSIHMNTFPAEKYHGTQVFYSRHNADSEVLANAMQTAVKTYLQPDNTRQIKPATSSIYLLDHCNGIAVLAECGFLSNIDEASRLSNAAYQEQLAAVLCASILNFLAGQP